jgi:hypothetical protein
MRQTRKSPRRCHRSCLARTCHCRTTSSWHRRGAAATSHAPHGPSESGCRRDAHDEAHMAQATSTKWAIMRRGLACAPENLSRSSQPDLGILSARREPGAHSDSELGPRWGRDPDPAAPLVDATRRPSDSDQGQARSPRTFDSAPATVGFKVQVIDAGVRVLRVAGAPKRGASGATSESPA